MQRGRRTAAGAVAGLSALLLAAPSPEAARTQLADAASSSDPTGPLVAAVALAAWATTAWLALTVAVVLLSRVPGLVGRAGAAAARCVAPAAVRRTVEAALGLTVAVGVLAPTAALAVPQAGPGSRGPTAESPTVDARTAEVTWDLDWPSRATPPPDVTAPRTPPATPPPSPAVTAPPRAATPSRDRPAPAPARPAPAAVRPAPVAATDAVVVRTGDTLWSLAEASLRTTGTADPSDRQVAQAWPQWWAANRAAIGDDPDLLLPGTVLHPPAGAP